jgi:hypothetical protein
MNRFSQFDAPMGSFDAEAALDEVLAMNQEEIDLLIQGENAEGEGVGANDPTRVSQPAEIAPVSGGAVADWLPWGEIQTHILDAYLDGDENWDSESMVALAKRLRTSIPELQMLVEATNPTEWSAKRFDALLERESLRKRGFDWDRLEHAALKKLTKLVETGRVSTASDILAVAKVANSATRKTGMNQPTVPGGVQVNINQYGSDGSPPELPGPGSLGTIQLTLTQRTVKQLGREKVIDGESTRLSDTIEMLGPEDIGTLSTMSDDIVRK